MLTIALSILLSVLQGPQTGTIVGIARVSGGTKPAQPARVALLSAKYTEVWNRQVQQRLDNYWEIYKPEFAANKERFAEFDRTTYMEAFASVTSTMRRELGDGASKYIKDTSPTGQFEFRGIPFGTYQVIVQTTADGRDVAWFRVVEVQSDIPIFVDLNKPVS